MTSSRTFPGPNGLLINAMLDHDDAQRPALAIIGWFADRTKVEITYSWGEATHHNGLPVELWCETMLRLLTAEQAVDIVQAALAQPTPAVTIRKHQP